MRMLFRAAKIKKKREPEPSLLIINKKD